jgi:hypothetical protein
MNVTIRIVLFSLAISGVCSLFSQSSYAVQGISRECAKGAASRFSIKEYENKMVSVCPANSTKDCIYTVVYGKTFIDSRLHLNADRLNDYVIKEFSSGYGNNDVTHLMLFAQCHDGKFIQVADDFFTTVKPDVMDAATGWLKLRVTRDCYNESIGDTQERSYTISFDPEQSKYGPPDGNPALKHYCSNAELALPVNSASAPQ